MKSKQIGVRLPDKVLAALDAYIASNVDENYSTVVRDALIEYLHLDYVDEISRGGTRPGAGRPKK